MQDNLSHIDSLTALQKEQELIRKSLKLQETDFKRKMQELPGELAVAGANTLIPKMLQGKITNTALNGGKFLINKFFVNNEGNTLLPGIRKPGIISVAKNLFSLFKKKK